MEEQNRLISREMIVNEFNFKPFGDRDFQFFYSTRRTELSWVVVRFFLDEKKIEIPRVSVVFANDGTELKYARTKKHLIDVLRMHLGKTFYINRDELDDELQELGINLSTRSTVGDVEEWMKENGYDKNNFNFIYSRFGLNKERFHESIEFKRFQAVERLIYFLKNKEV